jgi:SPP1 gp7 family putative phage head morphogenesis protein
MLSAPIPFEEAAALLKNKPPVTRAIFDRLLPELQARAFVITGVDAADALQMARDAIAEIPRGEDWRVTKKALIEKLEPYLGKAADQRVELLMRWHGYQAYAAANVANLDANTDLFPYRQYITANDGRVRETHAALEGLVLPADSPFWDRHTPPWEYGCRCDVRGITAEEAGEMQAADADKAPGRQRVAPEAVRTRLEQEGRLERDVNEIYDVRSAFERGASGPDWSSKDLRIPLDAIRERYDGEVWEKFRSWATGTVINGLNLMQWLEGEVFQLSAE